MPTTDPSFNFEVIKLLLQSAWADLEIDEAEKEFILNQARAMNLHPRDIEKIKAYLAGGAPLPPPDMGLLRWRRREVLEAVRQVLICDSRIAPDERVIWEEINTLLRD